MKSQQVYCLSIENANYKSVWDLQEKILAHNLDIKKLNRQNGTDWPTINVLLFCEHPPVYTLGKSGKMENLLLDESQLAQKNIEFHKINRGGDITYHGPGQITGYPVLDLECFKSSAAWYIDQLEELAILTAKHYGLTTERVDDLTGVWLNPKGLDARKLCAIGVKMSRWVSIHGFAFNVNTDLSYFNNIIPCGIDDKGVTSLANELGREIALEEVIDVMKNLFSKLFSAILQPISLNALEKLIENEQQT